MNTEQNKVLWRYEEVLKEFMKLEIEYDSATHMYELWILLPQFAERILLEAETLEELIRDIAGITERTERDYS